MWCDDSIRNIRNVDRSPNWPPIYDFVFLRASRSSCRSFWNASPVCNPTYGQLTVSRRFVYSMIFYCVASIIQRYCCMGAEKLQVRAHRSFFRIFRFRGFSFASSVPAGNPMLSQYGYPTFPLTCFQVCTEKDPCFRWSEVIFLSLYFPPTLFPLCLPYSL